MENNVSSFYFMSPVSGKIYFFVSYFLHFIYPFVLFEMQRDKNKMVDIQKGISHGLVHSSNSTIAWSGQEFDHRVELHPNPSFSGQEHKLLPVVYQTAYYQDPGLK